MDNRIKNTDKDKNNDLYEVCENKCMFGWSLLVDEKQVDSNKNIIKMVTKNGESIGMIKLYNLDNINKHAYINVISFDNADLVALKKSIVSILQYAFDELDLNKIYSAYLPSQVEIDRFWGSMGFVHEGTFRNHIFLNNEFCNVEVKSIFKHEFNRTFSSEKKAECIYNR